VLGRFSIRWRLAIISSALTFLILCAFAVVVGQLTTGKVRSSFDSETANSASELSDRLRIPSLPSSPTTYRIAPDINVYAVSTEAAIRLFDANRRPVQATRGAPDFGPPTREGSSEIKGYLVELVAATREPRAYGLPDLADFVQYGASPRATLALLSTARAHAFLQGRGYVIPEDVKEVAPDVLRHRVLLSYEAEAENVSSDQVVSRILERIEVP